MKLSFLAFFLLQATTTIHAHDDGTDHDHPHDDDSTWEVLSTTSLPKPLSDLTATLSSSDKVYIAGGCDSPLGNEFLEGFFACSSISSALYEFDILQNSFTTLAEMPQARYRHAAGIIDNQLWLIGGRTLQDDLIAEVDVYDFDSQTWSTPLQLETEYQTSDHGSFVHDEYMYIVGGYDANYTSLETTYRISSNGTIEPRAVLDQPRGDVTAVVHDSYAYVSGGFTHTNDFCQPLASVEEYTFSGDDWAAVAPMNIARAEKVLVSVPNSNRIYAIGGETHIENYCDTNVTHDVGEQTVAVDNVEVYDGRNWKVIYSLPNHKFRFAGVGVNDTIYTFGGQSAFEEGCQCYPTTKDVVAYVEVYGASGASSAGLVWMSAVSSILVGALSMV